MKIKKQNNITVIQNKKIKKFDIDNLLTDDAIIKTACITFSIMLLITISSISTQDKIYKETYLNMNKDEELRTAYYIQESEISKDGVIKDINFFNQLPLHEQKRILYLKRQGYSKLTDKITSIKETKETFKKLQNINLTEIQKQQIEKELNILKETKSILSK